MAERARILIVDDDPVIRLLAGSALTDVGHAVVDAEIAEAAIPLLGEARPDIILLDLQMPGIGGLAFCTWLRAQPAHARLPVLVMTSLDDSDTIQKAFDAGASDFIAKPFNFSILAHRVRFLLRARDTLQALEASRRNLQEAQVIARLGSWELDRASGIALCSDELYTVLDLDPLETPATVQRFMQGVHPDDRTRVQQGIAQAIERHEALDIIHRLLTRDGQIRWIQLRVKFEYDADGTAARSYGTVQDVTAQRRIEERIDYLTRHDPVTGLANRARFTEVLDERLAQHQAGTLDAVIHVDLDRYQRVNDSLGHEAGDALLLQVARRLAEALSGNARLPGEAALAVTLARWGGDEFMVLLTGLPSPHEASRVAHRLLGAIRRPFRSGGNEVMLDARAGIAIHPADGQSASELISACIAATHHAKSHDVRDLQFYSPDINTDARLQLQLEADLRAALGSTDGGGLMLHYQPKYDREGAIRCAEALIRWQHPTLGLLPPSRFIPLAEETGLIIPLGEWVIRHACRQLREWGDAGLPIVGVALNLSASHFLDAGLLPLLVAETERCGVPQHLIELELTESMIMQDTEFVRAVLRDMHEYGFRLALDDFGMGYSSLSQLSFLPLDTLKIDRAFIQDMLGVPRQAAVVRGIIALAKGLGLEVVAEGVETIEQAEVLRHEGCDLVQGYLYARPLPADEFARRLIA